MFIVIFNRLDNIFVNCIDFTCKKATLFLAIGIQIVLTTQENGTLKPCKFDLRQMLTPCLEIILNCVHKDWQVLEKEGY